MPWVTPPQNGCNASENGERHSSSCIRSAMVWLTAFCSGGALMIVRTVISQNLICSYFDLDLLWSFKSVMGGKRKLFLKTANAAQFISSTNTSQYSHLLENVDWHSQRASLAKSSLCPNWWLKSSKPLLFTLRKISKQGKRTLWAASYYNLALCG
jgi:hypothetical protein